MVDWKNLQIYETHFLIFTSLFWVILNIIQQIYNVHIIKTQLVKLGSYCDSKINGEHMK